ncbi:MAG TPA: LytTR family DNA-binding domain-containing protein, partial [Bacteroidales bacterium]|nr:LytTR family DNA-binding domain-containing protein [Bacteroidales bacterium]
RRVEVVGMAESVKEGVFAIYKHQPDLVFLDIEMPEENGFRLFDYFKSVDFEVIFTTAYRNYAIEAIRVAALDYLLKPITFIDLRDSLARLERKAGNPKPQQRIEELLHQLGGKDERYGKLAIPTFDGYVMEKMNHILYCEADQNYTNIFTLRGDRIMVSKPLGYIEEQLPPALFFRIHKSYLVNLSFIRSYSRKDSSHVVLENGEELPVATRRTEEFLRVLTNQKQE